jgi:hypothetical protein
MLAFVAATSLVLAVKTPKSNNSVINPMFLSIENGPFDNEKGSHFSSPTKILITKKGLSGAFGEEGTRMPVAISDGTMEDLFIFCIEVYRRRDANPPAVPLVAWPVPRSCPGC